MDKLMKPAEYAKELGISRQAVYAKIKRGILKAKNVDGKLYIIVDKTEIREDAQSESSPVTANKTASAKTKDTRESKRESKDYKALLEAKDETISVLKETVKDLKKSNKQISSTLRGEIDLLKDAFHEMRNLYVHQLERKQMHEAIEILPPEDENLEETSVEVADERWVGIKKFFKELSIKKEKQQEKLLKRLKKAFKSGDSRLKKEQGKLKLNANTDYEDLVKK